MALSIVGVDRITALRIHVGPNSPRLVYIDIIAMPPKGKVRKAKLWPNDELARALEADAEVRELLGAIRNIFCVGLNRVCAFFAKPFTHVHESKKHCMHDWVTFNMIQNRAKVQAYKTIVQNVSDS